MSLIELRELLEACWDKDTTYCVEDYDYHDASWGQCAVTALVVQDYFGGDLRKGEAFRGNYSTRHYWNLLPFGQDTDLTWRQFPIGTRLRKVQSANRKQLLKNKWMVERYEKLKNKVEHLIKIKEAVTKSYAK